MRFEWLRTSCALLAILNFACAANPGKHAPADLRAARPTCLVLDWGAAPWPTYLGYRVPDTLLLLPATGEDPKPGRSGPVHFSSSSPRNDALIWFWSVVGDTLAVMASPPTMDDLMIRIGRPTMGSATWRMSGLDHRNGQVRVQECRTTPSMSAD